MFDDGFFMNMLRQLVWSLPTLLVCIVGIMMMQTRPLPRKTKTLGTAGLVLVVLGAMGGIVFNTYLSIGSLDYSGAGFRYVQMGYGALMQILHITSLILMVMAIFNKDNTATTGNSVENPYE